MKVGFIECKGSNKDDFILIENHFYNFHFFIINR